MVTTVRSNMAVNDNAYMKTVSGDRGTRPRAVVPLRPELGRADLQELQPLHVGACARLLLVQHLHCTNWVVNGMGERFPKLPVVWIESGLAWVPFLMQRLDHEYMLRPSEAPLLKKKPSDYMRDMFYSSQPMEIQDTAAWSARSA
jgi:predicted TIM-barrel fold metal-dependent hydrolase